MDDTHLGLLIMLTTYTLRKIEEDVRELEHPARYCLLPGRPQKPPPLSKQDIIEQLTRYRGFAEEMLRLATELLPKDADSDVRNVLSATVKRIGEAVDDLTRRLEERQ